MRDPFPEVESLLPHRGAMLLIDAVESFGDGRLACTAVVRKDNPFLEGGILANHSLIEYIAQAAACHAGLRATTEGSAVQVEGHLVRAGSVALLDHPVETGDELVVEVLVEGGTAEFEAYTGRVESGGKTVCTARIGIYHPDSSGGGI